jgi:hypothetical protein
MRRNRDRTRGQNEVAAALDRIEPELRQLEGLALLLQMLAAAPDAVDQIAFEPLARAANSIHCELVGAWKELQGSHRDTVDPRPG